MKLNRLRVVSLDGLRVFARFVEERELDFVAALVWTVESTPRTSASARIVVVVDDWSLAKLDSEH